MSNQDERAIEREKNRKAAEAEMLRTTQVMVGVLQSRLPSIFTVEREVSEYNGHPRVALVIKAVKTEFAYRIGYTVAPSGRYSWSTGMEIVGRGSRYDRERRSFEPLYRPSKVNGWASVMERMPADIERAYASWKAQRDRHEAQRVRESQSAESLRRVLEVFPTAKALYGSTYTVVKGGPIEVRVEAGSFNDGRVRVSVTMSEGYVNAERAIDLIEQLRKIR